MSCSESWGDILYLQRSLSLYNLEKAHGDFASYPNGSFRVHLKDQRAEILTLADPQTGTTKDPWAETLSSCEGSLSIGANPVTRSKESLWQDRVGFLQDPRTEIFVSPRMESFWLPYRIFVWKNPMVRSWTAPICLIHAHIACRYYQNNTFFHVVLRTCSLPALFRVSCRNHSIMCCSCITMSLQLHFTEPIGFMRWRPDKSQRIFAQSVIFDRFVGVLHNVLAKVEQKGAWPSSLETRVWPKTPETGPLAQWMNEQTVSSLLMILIVCNI